MPDATGDARTRALVQHLRATAIPLLAAWITRDGMPVIVLNTARRPEVSDLFRVQAQVGQGEATSIWHFAYLHEHRLRCAWLVVDIADPVEVELVIEFNLSDATMWAVIDAAERSGTIWLVNNEGLARAPAVCRHPDRHSAAARLTTRKDEPSSKTLPPTRVVAPVRA